MWSRRGILAGFTAFPALSGVAFAGGTARRTVVVLLRGGLDGLAAVPAVGDPAFEALRGGADDRVALDGVFALHPALAPLAPLWADGQLAVVHATATPYAGRSHFEAQDLLEGGGRTPHETTDGWLGRAVAIADTEAVAVGPHVPLLLRGPSHAASLDPRRDLGLAVDFETEVAAMYARDPLLGAALAQGLAMREQAGDPEAGAAGGAGQARRTGEAVGRLLSSAEGPRVAVLELNGWDTHVAQEATLARQLAGLADAVVALRTSLGPVWSDTAVVVLTEFGRRVAPNGTGGTDHGVGGIALLAGGAVRGGRVIADWPGLAARDLVEGRDLRSTLDLRAVEKALCTQHLGLDPARVDREVFPGAGGVSEVPLLFG
jgi:uncharacterized protein (DUF1501 family)